MKVTATHFAILWTIVASFTAGSTLSAAQAQPDEDRQGVYHLRPTTDDDVQVVRVGPEEVQPGLAYSYFNERLSRRVWGFARDDGTFQYAFGERTMLPADRFDRGLDLPSPSSMVDVVEETPFGLQSDSAATSGPPAVMMGADGNWRLIAFRVEPRVFDLETDHRWEWHGRRRVAVVHTYGDRWQIADGRFQPLGGSSRSAIAPIVCGPLSRVGSASFLVRTPEPAP